MSKFNKINNNIMKDLLLPLNLGSLQNFPFIEGDFDAITNYELLCKVVEFLNKVIKSQNDLIINVDNHMKEQDSKIDDAVNYLKDNLVETVSNLLEQMIEEGTLNVLLQYNASNESLNLTVSRESGDNNG